MSKNVILVAVSDSIEARDIKKTLESEGYNVLEIVTTSGDALKNISKYWPDLILMDAFLKGDKNGIAAAEIIKKKYKIPVIFLTTHSEDLNFGKIKNTDPNTYLMRPFDSKDLIRTITVELNKNEIEKELENSKEHFKNLFENSPIGIFHSSTEGKFHMVNTAMSDMFGYDSTEDLINEVNKTSITEKLYVDPINRPKFVDDVIKDDNWHSYINRYYKKDGSIMTADLSFRAVKDHNLDIEYLEGFIKDVTWEREAELALSKSEDQYRTLFESDPNYTILIDTNHLIVDVNAATTDITGLSKEKLIGKHLNDLTIILEKDRLLHVDKIIDSLDGNEVKPFEARLMDKNGNLRWVNVRLTSIGKENIISNILIIASDITELKQYENEIKDSLHEKEILLQEIHHRVKNNMQIISSLLSIQTRYVNDNEAINVLKESQNRVKSLAMIHEKLYKSKNFNKIHLMDYIESLVWDLFYSYAIEKGRIEPILDIDDIKLNIETSVPCGLIITELVSNSLKYAFPGDSQGALKVLLRTIDDHYELIISDNGIGIPENIDFYNTDSLGLQLVNSLTDQIDGEIEFDRSNGTKFKITFKELVYKDRF